jgi:hypothetical protein
MTLLEHSLVYVLLVHDEQMMQMMMQMMQGGGMQGGGMQGGDCGNQSNNSSDPSSYAIQ